MDPLEHIFKNNEKWAESVVLNDPEYFSKMSEKQSPKFLWIGCSDSRVPPETIAGAGPGELFVHRNVGNIVDLSDSNCMAVIEYAVCTLNVEHIIVCGHYGCGAVCAAFSDEENGSVSQWIIPIRGTLSKHGEMLCNTMDISEMWNRLCELNVAEQVETIRLAPVVQKAWGNGSKLTIHGLIYDLHCGYLKNLNISVNC